jgi:hypothetical protein
MEHEDHKESIVDMHKFTQYILVKKTLSFIDYENILILLQQ